MIEQLKNFRSESAGFNVEELVELSAAARAVTAEFEQLNAETPEWITKQANEVRRAIRDQQRDALEARLKTAMARRDALKTPDEKRKEIDAEIERLTKTLQPA